MNEQTAALLQGLADKLGTTSAYLWTVLLKQAPIAGWIMLVEYGLTIIALLAFYRYRAKVSAFFSEWMRQEEFTGGGAVVVLGIAAIIWLVACAFSFSTMLTAFLNPEYWALKEVLDAVKPRK